MEFNIKFKAESKKEEHPVVLDSVYCEFGTQVIDELREHFNVTEEECPIELIIKDTYCSKKTQLEITLSEEQARGCGDLFAERNFIEVKVPDKFLTPFQGFAYDRTLQYKRIIFPTSKKLDDLIFLGIHIASKPIYSYRVFRKVLLKEMIEAWQKDGCPLRWGFKTE